MLLVSGNEASRILRAMWISNIIWAFMKVMPSLIWRVALVSILAIVADPTAIATVPCENLVMSDSRVEKLTIKGADNRAIPLEISYPATPGKYPLVVFSHGAFASPGRYHALLTTRPPLQESDQSAVHFRISNTLAWSSVQMTLCWSVAAAMSAASMSRGLASKP